MFGNLIVAYLFLGGAGAGACAVACTLDLALVKTRYGSRLRTSPDNARPGERLVARTALAGLAMLLAGVLCLVFDLGRADRIALLLTRPAPSFITVGAYSLAILMALMAPLAAAQHLYLPRFRRGIAAACSVLAIVAALLVMSYTGLFLTSMSSVAFWSVPSLPVLFVLSSCACGTAVSLGFASTIESDFPVAKAKTILTRADMLLIVGEIVVALWHLVAVAAHAGPEGLRAVERVLAGDLATWWWTFAIFGLLLPLGIEIAWFFKRKARPTPAFLVVVALSTLLSGFIMRYAVVQAGTHRPPEFTDIVAKSPSANQPQALETRMD